MLTAGIVRRWSGRSPHGERGLKLLVVVGGFEQPESLSSRRAWIEILLNVMLELSAVGRSPHGERGLK